MPWLSAPYRLYPRGLYFDHDGKCVGKCYMHRRGDPPLKLEVVHLPSDHYDFIGPIEYMGKTLAQIKRAVVAFKQPCEGCKKDNLSIQFDPRDVVCGECGDKQRKLHEELDVRAGRRYLDESKDAARDRIADMMQDIGVDVY